MSLRSLRQVSVVLVAALVLACSSSDDKPKSSGTSGDAGADNAAGEPGVAGKSGTSGSTGTSGSGSDGGSSGKGGSAGMNQGDAGMPDQGDAGMPATGGNTDAPKLDGDGIAWTWNGNSYLVNKKMHAGFFGQVERVNISGSDTDDSVAPNLFDLHLMPNKIGTYKCSDVMTGTDASFSINWLTFDQTKSPPNPGFTYSKDLPCEFTVTRADKGDTVGDVFEGTFKAGLVFAGIPGVWERQERLGIVGTMRWTKR